MPLFVYLHLEQPHLSHPGHGGAVVPGSRNATVPTGSGGVPQLSFHVCACRCEILSFLGVILLVVIFHVSKKNTLGTVCLKEY